MEARGAMAAALSEELVERMAAVTALRTRLERALRPEDDLAGDDDVGDVTEGHRGDDADDSTDEDLDGEHGGSAGARDGLATPAHRYSAAGLALGAYEGFTAS